MEWLSNRGLVGTYIIGLYASIIPMCLCLVSITKSGYDNEFVIMYLILCSMLAPVFTLQYMRTLACRMYKKEESRG